MAQSVKYRISKSEALFFFLISIIADGIQILFKILWLTGILAILGEALGWAVAGGAYIMLFLSFAASGVHPAKGFRGTMRILTGIVAEGMPLLNAFIPGITIWTWLTIRQSRKEDRERALYNARIEEQAIARQRAMSAAVDNRRREPYLGAPAARRSGIERRTASVARHALRKIPHPTARVADVALKRTSSQKGRDSNIERHI